MSRSSKSNSIGSKDSLCCCEYLNMHGERSHVLATCCDCEALDEAFDKIFKCERIPESTIDRFLNTVSDRCRLPFCFGNGAIKLRPDVVIPVIVVPACLCLATLHPAMTVLCFLSMPVIFLMFHALWRRKDKTRPTLFFYSWGVTSVICSYLVFQFFVVAFREVLLWEILTVFTSMMIMFYFLYTARSDPESLKIPFKTHPGHKRTPSNAHLDGSSFLYDQKSDQEAATNEDLVGVSVEGKNLPESNVKWMDSRQPMARADLPPRAGYCKICDAYIAVRDHHCIWIDSCVGATNHRSFFMAMLMFVLTGIYSCHLTFTTICTPRMYFDWFLLPNDCRWLYVDFLTSICFVTAIYGILATACMLCGLIFQITLISQNLTAHELVHAHRQGQTRCVLFAVDNPYNRGFLQNWIDFFFTESRGVNTKTIA